jgi:hypothetical protein
MLPEQASAKTRRHVIALVQDKVEQPVHKPGVLFLGIIFEWEKFQTELWGIFDRN